MGGEIIKVSDFIVEPVPRSAIQKFVEKWHYSHSTNGVQHTQCFALFDDMKISYVLKNCLGNLMRIFF